MLFGSAGKWKTKLKVRRSDKIKFPANSLVEIKLKGPPLGELGKLKIWVE
jgi:hypothetical protein